VLIFDSVYLKFLSVLKRITTIIHTANKVASIFLPDGRNRAGLKQIEFKVKEIESVWVSYGRTKCLRNVGSTPVEIHISN